MTTKLTKLLVTVEAPDIRPGLNAQLQRDIKTLAVDCLGLMQRNSQFDIKVNVVSLNEPLLTKADNARHLGVSTRTLERYIAEGKFPQPIRVPGPRWRAEDVAKYTVRAVE